MVNKADIANIKKEIERLEANALEMYENKRVPNRNNHNRLLQLKKQLDKMLKEYNRV